MAFLGKLQIHLKHEFIPSTFGTLGFIKHPIKNDFPTKNKVVEASKIVFTVMAVAAAAFLAYGLIASIADPSSLQSFGGMEQFWDGYKTFALITLGLGVFKLGHAFFRALPILSSGGTINLDETSGGTDNPPREAYGANYTD